MIQFLQNNPLAVLSLVLSVLFFAVRILLLWKEMQDLKGYKNNNKHNHVFTYKNRKLNRRVMDAA
jgi:predicted Holliday junction resolvase-like endonuclease